MMNVYISWPKTVVAYSIKPEDVMMYILVYIPQLFLDRLILFYWFKMCQSAIIIPKCVATFCWIPTVSVSMETKSSI